MQIAGKRFQATNNSINGTLNNETILSFTKEDEVITGNYSGGTITTGNVIAKRLSPYELEMLYHGANTEGNIQAGFAKATFTRINDNKYQMDLDWQWLNGDKSDGQSRWIEI